MKLMKNKIDKKSILIILIATIISITSSYVLAQTLVNSKDVYYEDNSGLAVNNVQAAIDGTCTKFSNQLQDFLLKVYPIGSIYISYNSTNPETLFGGTWEAYGKGQTLVGIDTNQTEFNTVGKTGGEKTHTLTVDEMPIHNHTVTATGDVSSTFTGSQVNTGDAGTHTHSLVAGGKILGLSTTSSAYSGSTELGFSLSSSAKYWRNANKDSTTIAAVGNHHHTITAAGTVSSTFTGTQTVTSDAGKGKEYTNLQPYTTVYMWRRTK